MTKQDTDNIIQKAAGLIKLTKDKYEKARANTKAKMVAHAQAWQIYEARRKATNVWLDANATARNAHNKAEASIKTTKEAATAAHKAFVLKLMASGDTAPVDAQKAVPCVTIPTEPQVKQIFDMMETTRGKPISVRDFEMFGKRLEGIKLNQTIGQAFEQGLKSTLKDGKITYNELKVALPNIAEKFNKDHSTCVGHLDVAAKII